MGAEFTGLKEFVIDSLIGEGGMGRVYRARQVSLDRWVALKVLTHAKGMRDYIGRFKREARSAAGLVHPNIIQIYTIGEHEGTPFYAMELIDGVDLQRMIRSHPEPLSVEESLEVVRCVGKALALAAEQGIVHRDIKPANIMLAKGGIIKVMDFGLAKGQYGAAGTALTQPGVIVGTPAYMSPEQGTGKPVDIRSDIYSLGCVLYTCLCDRPPFTADDMASLIYKHAYEPPSTPSTHRPGLVPEVDSFCLKMLAKDPADRFQKPEDLLKALTCLPFNLGQAETSLAERVNTLLKAKQKAAAPSERNTPGATPRTKKETPTVRYSPEVEQAVSLPGSLQARQPAPPSLRARDELREQPKGAAAKPEPPALPPAPAPRRDGVGRGNSTTVTQARQPPAPLPQPGVMVGRWVAVPMQPSLAKPPEPGQATPGAVSAGEQQALLPAAHAMSRAETQLRSLASIFREKFQKLRDGRWSYRTELGSCSSAEGLVETLPAPPGEKPSGLGDCLLCLNWNKNLGCALAFSHYLEVQEQHWGLPLATRQANAWAGAGRFDVAIGLLSAFVREHPEDPEGFRELARIYDRPDYDGPDKRRAIVLYRRFAELARTVGSFAEFEIRRAEEHAQALLSAPVEPRKAVIPAAAGVVFQCFYRGAAVCFVHGVIACDRLILARAGEADPASGTYAQDVCGPRALSTAVHKLLRQKTALALARQHLSRLARLGLEDLAKDRACIAVIGAGEMRQVRLTTDRPSSMYCLTVLAAKTHELLFPEASTFTADQCHEALRRQIAKTKTPNPRSETRRNSKEGKL